MTGTVSLDNSASFSFADESQSGGEEAYFQDDQFLMLDDFDGPLEPLEEESAFGLGSMEPASGPAPKRKSRRPPSTAERRATHNAVERARRESLNGRFMDLARALPSMANVKRPSKSIIVNKSLEFVTSAVARERTLISENDALRTEVNELRARLGMPALPTPPQSKTSRAAAKEVSRPRQPSIASIATTASSTADSPKFSGSPLSVNSFDLSTALAPSAGSPSATSDIVNTPVTTGFPLMDMNYLMALQMQQAQAQNMLKMSAAAAAGGPFAFAPTWPMQIPVSAAPDLTNNWLFA